MIFDVLFDASVDNTPSKTCKVEENIALIQRLLYAITCFIHYVNGYFKGDFYYGYRTLAIRFDQE